MFEIYRVTEKPNKNNTRNDIFIIIKEIQHIKPSVKKNVPFFRILQETQAHKKPTSHREREQT